MKKALIAVSLSSLLSTAAQADAIGVYIGGHYWDNEASGILGEENNLVDFNLADEQQTSFYIALEHPLPFIPNGKISRTTLETKGSTQLTSDFEFDGTTFQAGTTAATNFDVSYTDYTVYYEIFDNGLLTFDIGVTARDFDGSVSVYAQTMTTDENGDDITLSLKGDIGVTQMVPMLYASTIVGLPLTGLNLFAEGTFLSIDDHTLYDYQAGISYELIDNMVIDVNVTAGYREVKLELDDLDDLYTDIEFSGVFAGVVVHF